MGIYFRFFPEEWYYAAYANSLNERDIKNPHNGRFKGLMPEKKLLIIHQGALGDFVLTFPSVLELKSSFTHIDALCQRKLGRLACKLGLIDKGIPLETAAFASLYADHCSHVDPHVKNRIRSYDAIILFSYATELEQNLIHITTCPVYRILPRPEISHNLHVCEYIRKQLADLKLIKADENGFKPALYPVRPANARWRGHQSQRVLIHPGSGSRKKNWPVSRFLELEKMLRADGWQPEFILGPAEYDMEDELKIRAGHRIKIHRMSDLDQVSSHLCAVGGFIGNDSGITHLAAFLGLPTVAVFGPSDPARWAPIGPAVRIIRSDMECAPCFEENKTPCDIMECLNNISPERVWATFRQLTQQRQTAAPCRL